MGRYRCTQAHLNWLSCGRERNDSKTASDGCDGMSSTVKVTWKGDLDFALHERCLVWRRAFHWSAAVDDELIETTEWEETLEQSDSAMDTKPSVTALQAS